jgi:hypothetical protein
LREGLRRCASDDRERYVEYLLVAIGRINEVRKQAKERYFTGLIKAPGLQIAGYKPLRKESAAPRVQDMLEAKPTKVCGEP